MPQPYSQLQNIYTKIRRLTRSPSPAQLSNDDINNYVNQFVLYDMPQHLRLFDLKTTLTFYTKPYIAEYSTNTTDATDPLYNFKNKYISVHDPLYVAGYRRFFSQSREQFYGIYPQSTVIGQTGLFGDGGTTDFTGYLSMAAAPTGIPVLQNYVTFSTIDSISEGMYLKDNPVSAELGTLTGDAGAGVNTINYITGEYHLSFNIAPGMGQAIYYQVIPYQPAIPQAVLYFDDKFFIRPVPDQCYPVTFDVFIQPAELMSTNTAQTPEIEQWAQYIAYGAARKVFQDRLDMDSLQLIEPEYKQQELLVLRKTIMQLSNQRTSTIFTEGSGNYPYGGWGFFTPQF